MVVGLHEQNQPSERCDMSIELQNAEYQLGESFKLERKLQRKLVELAAKGFPKGTPGQREAYSRLEEELTETLEWQGFLRGQETLAYALE